MMKRKINIGNLILSLTMGSVRGRKNDKIPHRVRDDSFSDGFTLVELLVVVALTALLLVGVSNLFLATIRGGGRADVLASLKNEGDSALVTMERLIRGGNDVDGCNGSNWIDELVVKYIDPTNNVVLFHAIDGNGLGYLARDDDTDHSSGVVRLTSEEVNVMPVAGNAQVFLCTDQSNTFYADEVTIMFDLSIPNSTLGESFETKVTQRNTSSD
jgi:prepilin-type N-terminal cleavage/methylation domain-containing protein